MSSVSICIFVFFFRQVGWLSIEGTLHMREPKKGWKQSHLSLKNGYLSVNKERGVSSNSQFIVVKTVLNRLGNHTHLLLSKSLHRLSLFGLLLK